MTHSGPCVKKLLAQPPHHTLCHHQPQSLTVRQATAYATWLEAACDVCASCAVLATQQPVAIHCPGLLTALGPALQWLIDCGFKVQEHGLSSGP